MCKYGEEDYFPFTLSYLADIVFVLHASEEPLANAAAAFEGWALDRFPWHFQKGCFTSQRFPLSYITLGHLLCDPWDHRAVVFKISIAESIPCPTSICRHYLSSQFTDGKRGGKRVASFSGQLHAQAESQRWQQACHRQAQGGRMRAPHAVPSPSSHTILEAKSSLCLRFPSPLFWGSVAPAIVSVLFLDFMVSFQDLMAFQQVEHLRFVALQSYLESIAL